MASLVFRQHVETNVNATVFGYAYPCQIIVCNIGTVTFRRLQVAKWTPLAIYNAATPCSGGWSSGAGSSDGSPGSGSSDRRSGGGSSGRSSGGGSLLVRFAR